MKNYFNIKGRINRVELLSLSLVLYFLEVLNYYIFYNDYPHGFVLISIILFVLYLMQCAKRYHDLNKWGLNGFIWWVIPIANIFYFIQLYASKGTSGINRYGEPSDFKISKSKKAPERKEDINFTIRKDNMVENPDSLYDVISFKTIQEKLYKKDRQVKFIKQPDNDIFKIESVELKLWNKKDGDYCRVGDKICTLRVRRKFNHEDIAIYSKEIGILKTLVEQSFGFNGKKIKDNELIFKIDSSVGNQIFNTPIIEDDKFNKSQTLKWLKVGGNNFYEKRLNGFILTLTEKGQRLFLTINNINAKDFIVINYPQKDFEIKAGDKFQILLESQDLINLTFSQNSYTSYESNDEDLKKINENLLPICSNDLQLLSIYKIENWKLTLKNGQVISGIRPYGREHAYLTFKDLQEMIKLLFTDYLFELNKIEKYEPINNYNNCYTEQTKEECYLYLMIDLTNNYHKIGISNNPVYRERTLQSEKPTIELVASKKFPSRQIALSVEKALHETYKQKNIRGEWFNLNQIDINEIKEVLK